MMSVAQNVSSWLRSTVAYLDDDANGEDVLDRMFRKKQYGRIVAVAVAVLGMLWLVMAAFG